MTDIITQINEAQLRKDMPVIAPGDTVRVHAKVVEGTRERLQVFEGVVIRLRKGGINKNLTVRRITHGVGVERTFLINSPRIDKIEVVRHAQVRRAQLYYLRGLFGKAARLKERRDDIGANLRSARAKGAPTTPAAASVVAPEVAVASPIPTEVAGASAAAPEPVVTSPSAPEVAGTPVTAPESAVATAIPTEVAGATAAAPEPVVSPATPPVTSTVVTAAPEATPTEPEATPPAEHNPSTPQ